MTDQPDLLEDPDGAPYPQSVQVFIAEHFPDLEPVDDQEMRQNLTHALEATIAADREHRPPRELELDDETAGLLLNLYLSGMASGSATTLLQSGADGEQSQQVAMLLVRRMADDPAVRYDMQEMVARYWRQPAEHAEWQSFTSHAQQQPRNHRDD